MYTLIMNVCINKNFLKNYNVRKKEKRYTKTFSKIWASNFNALHFPRGSCRLDINYARIL